MLAFVHKLPCRDDDGVTAKDLSKVRGGPTMDGRVVALSSPYLQFPEGLSFVTIEP